MHNLTIFSETLSSQKIMNLGVELRIFPLPPPDKEALALELTASIWSTLTLNVTKNSKAHYFLFGQDFSYGADMD